MLQVACTFMRSHRLAAAATALALLVPLAACSGSSDAGSAPTTTAKPTSSGSKGSTTTTAPAAEAFTGSVEAFYEVPDTLPAGPHGTLIRYQPMDDYDIPGATTYRILYRSESVQGDPIAVSGMASVPTADAPADGRPMITISHGTTGIADACAPSKNPVSTEMSLVGAKLGDRFLLAHTDDEGLGTPGRHPYLVGESEGRSALDAIVAAGQLPDADPGTKLGIAGYSQGGHGALWTSQVARDWTPDLEVVGTFSGAPASEIGVIIAAASQVKGFGMMVIAGLHEAYPDTDLSQVLTPKGIEVLDSVDEGCAGQTFAAVGGYDASEIFVPDGGTSGRWAELANAQNAGSEKTNDAPTLIIHSNADGTVPTFFIDQVTARMCANDQVVDRRDIDGGGHTEAAIPAYETAIPWLEARFAADGTAGASDADAATAVEDTCSTT